MAQSFLVAPSCGKGTNLLICQRNLWYLYAVDFSEHWFFDFVEYHVAITQVCLYMPFRIGQSC